MAQPVLPCLLFRLTKWVEVECFKRPRRFTCLLWQGGGERKASSYIRGPLIRRGADPPIFEGGQCIGFACPIGRLCLLKEFPYRVCRSSLINLLLFLFFVFG